MTQVWSCGGGTQSAAIAVLIIQGKLPKPDVALIVDTNREKSSTWAYCDQWIAPNLAAIGVDLKRIDSSQYKTCDLWSTNDENLLMPVYTTQGDKPGKLPAYCSNEWKRRVVERYLKESKITPATIWMGISLDEMSRVRTANQQWLQPRYPLIFDVPMHRQDCINLVLEMGWPEPPRSSCWMCPNMRNSEWMEMKTNWPDDFHRAVELERQLRERDPHAWLHSSCIPLDEVDFIGQQSTFFDNSCSSGFCGN